MANIVANPSETEVLQAQMLDDVRKLAETTHDTFLQNKLQEFEKYIDELRRQKEEAEKQAQAAQEKAREEQRKREQEEQKHQETTKNLQAQIQKNKYLQATQNTSREVQDLMHAVLISSNDATSLISIAKAQLDAKDYSALRTTLDKFEYHTTKINKLSKLITKADTALLADSTNIDIHSFVTEYLDNYNDAFAIEYVSDIKEPLEKKISILDLSIVLDNLISNSRKAKATALRIDFARQGRTYVVDFTDNGVGVDLDLYTPESIFEEGVTNRRGGSGIGLSTIKDRMQNELNGDIAFIGNGLHFKTGATFRLTFE